MIYKRRIRWWCPSWHSINICTAVHYSLCITIQTCYYRYASCHMADTANSWTSVQPKYHLIQREMKPNVLTSCPVVYNCNCQMNLSGCHVTGGADRIVPGFQEWQLSQEESCWDLSRGKLLQHLQDVRAVVKLPFIVFFCALKAKSHHDNVSRSFTLRSGEQGYLKCHL